MQKVAIRAGFFILTILFFNQFSRAQDSTTVRALDEVVITANKYPTKASATGKVLNVITRRQLEQAGGKDISQLLNEQTGIYINGANSNPGKDKAVFLRGAKVDYTLILIDGVPVYDATGIGSNFDIRQIPVEHIERVEILKGSHSTLYGSDAIAGVINIITRKSADMPLRFSGKMSYGSYNTVRANAALQGNKNGFDYSLGYGITTTDGIDETIDTSGSNAIRDKDGFTQHSVNASMGWKASEKLYISPYLRFSGLQADIDQGAFVDELDYTSALNNWQAGLRSVATIDKVKLNFLYNYNYTDRNYLDDSVKSRNGFATYLTGVYKGYEHFMDAYLNIPVQKNIHLTAGADFRRAATSHQLFSMSSFGPFTTAFDKDTTRHNQLAVYATALLTSTRGFSLEAGGRWNHHNEYGSHFVYNINPSVLLNEQFKVFLNISSGYKTPSLYQLYSEFGNTALKPENALTFEAGLQYFATGDRFNARATFFNRYVQDVIAFIYNPSTFLSQYINQDEQEDQGLEAEASLKIGTRTTLKINYTYVDGKLTTKNNGKDTTYFNLFRRPRHTIGTTIGMQVSSQFFISTSFQSLSERFDQVYDANFSLVNVSMKAYVLWDAYAEYGFTERVKLFVDVRNITGSKFQEVYGYRSPGLNGYVGVRLNL